MYRFTPNKERILRKALRGATQKALIAEAYRVIGREKNELKRQIQRGDGSLLIERVIQAYSGGTQSDETARRRMLDRLAKDATAAKLREEVSA